MGENRFFIVESKSFEIVKNAIELSIIERRRNHLSIVTMGFVAALWLCDVLLEVSKLSNDQNLFRSFHEGNKIFVLQKQRNGKGRFVTITALGESKSKGYVIIPERQDAFGWQGLSQEIMVLWLRRTLGMQLINGGQYQHFTAPGNQGSNSLKDSRTFKEAVIQGDSTPNISLGISGNQSDLRQICNGSGKDMLEISLKVILGIGPGGGWEVKWAGVLPCEDKGPTPHQAHNINKPEKLGEAGSGSTMISPDLDRVSIHSCESESQQSSQCSLIPAPPTACQPIAKVMKDIGETEDAITQKLVHWVSSHWEVVDSGDDVEDSDMGLLGVDYGSDMEGVLSGCEEIVPIEFRPCLLNKESRKLRP
uniref:Uncharacterized protein n=1 Tax=Fagus sylvatica TaxID=28930 RepID=A0A2N9IKL7_FAGSY